MQAATEPPVIQVPITPPAHLLTFYVQVAAWRRNNLNELAAEEGSVVHHVLQLAIGYDHRIYTGWKLDAEAGVLCLRLNGIVVQVPLSNLSVEEMAAVRFLTAAVDPLVPCRTHSWRAHVVEQLGTMVPLLDYDGDPVDPVRVATHFKNLIVQN